MFKQIKDIAITKEAAEDGDLLVMQNPSTGKTYNIKIENLLARFLNGGGSSGGGGATVESKLTGTPFGASPSYSVGSEYDKAFDGSVSTFYDYAYPSGGYCGIDLGTANTKKLTKVKVYPRQDSNVQTRSSGAVIQGSNTGVNSDYVDLFTFGSTPNTGTWYEGTITTSTVYRYLRYRAADNTYCNVAEVEFWGL